MAKMARKIFKIFFVPAYIFMPFLACYAQTFRSIFRRGIDVLLNFALPFILTLGVAYFIWGVVKFISAGGDAEKIKKARTAIVWGLLGLFFMIAFWAVVYMILTTFFGGIPERPANFPPVPFP